MATVIVTPDLFHAAVAAAGVGDTIRLEPGRYGPARVLVKAGVTIEGRPDAVLSMQVQPQTAGVTLRGLRFEGPFDGGAAIYGLGAPGLRVEGCEITGSHEQSIFLDRCDDARVIGNRVHDSGIDSGSSGHHGVYVANSRRVTATGNRFERVAGFGIQLGPQTHDCDVGGNIVDGCGQYGVTIWGGSSGNTVAGCSFANTGKGPATSYQAGAGNVIQNCTADRDWPLSLAGVTLTGNTVSTEPPPEPEPEPEPEPAPAPCGCCQRAADALAELERIKKPSLRVKAAIVILKG